MLSRFPHCNIRCNIFYAFFNEESKTWFPLIAVIRPWISRDYTGYSFVANDGRTIREFGFQQNLDEDKAYEYADLFYGLDSADEVCAEAAKLKKQGVIIS